MKTINFESIDSPADLESLALDQRDIRALAACTLPCHWGALQQALRQYPALRDAFLADSADRAGFAAYVRCLLTLAYGHRGAEMWQRISRFLDEECYPHPPAAGFSKAPPPDWLRDCVYYELYVDLFAADFAGLTRRLDYLSDLGVTVLWLTPFLDSPGDDAGYDQRNRYGISEKLGSEDDFRRFTAAARERGMTLMMDLVSNHRSWECAEFQASADPGHPQHARFRDFFIWEEGAADRPPPRFSGLRSVMGGSMAPQSGAGVLSQAGKLVEGVWSWHAVRGAWYYHSFLPQQPDVNTDNSEVLIDELRTLKHWLDGGGISHIRLDAIPFLFKRDRRSVPPETAEAFPQAGEVLESYGGVDLPQVHMLVRLINAFLAHRYNHNVVLVTEVNAPIPQWRKYYGGGVEGRVNYAFLHMQGLWTSLAAESAEPLGRAIEAVGELPPGCSGIVFARVHDELSFDSFGGQGDPRLRAGLEKALLAHTARLPAEDRGIVARLAERMGAARHSFAVLPHLYCGRGAASRLTEILAALPPRAGLTAAEDLAEKHRLLMTLMMSLDIPPLIYMGDEWGERDNWEYLLKLSDAGQGIDQRQLHRPIRDMETPLCLLKGGQSLEHRLHAAVRRIIAVRRGSRVMMRGKAEVIETGSGAVLGVRRSLEKQAVLVLGNLSAVPQKVKLSRGDNRTGVFMDLLSERAINAVKCGSGLELEMAPRQALWLTADASGSCQ